MSRNKHEIRICCNGKAAEGRIHIDETNDERIIERIVEYLTTKKSLRKVAGKNSSKSTLSKTVRSFVAVLPPLIVAIQKLRPKWNPYMIIDITQVSEFNGIRFYLIMAIDTNGVPIYARITTSHNWRDLVNFLAVIKNELGYKPKLVICDWAAEILSAVRTVYPKVPIQRCWAHMLIECKKKGFAHSSDEMERNVYSTIGEIYSIFKKHYLEEIKKLKKKQTKIGHRHKLEIWKHMCDLFMRRYEVLKELLKLAEVRGKRNIAKFLKNVIATESNLLAFTNFAFSRPDIQPIEIRFRYIKGKMKMLLSKSYGGREKVGEKINYLRGITDLLVLATLLKKTKRLTDLHEIIDDELFQEVYKKIDIKLPTRINENNTTDELHETKIMTSTSPLFREVSRRNIRSGQQDLIRDYGFNVPISRVNRRRKKTKYLCCVYRLDNF